MYPVSHIAVPNFVYGNVSWLNKGAESKLISYRWDFNGDGDWDKSGKQVTHSYTNEELGVQRRSKCKTASNRLQARNSNHAWW